MLMTPPEQINANFEHIVKKINSDYSANQSLWQVFWTEANIDSRLEAGDVSLLTEFGQQQSNNRNSWYFNRVRPLCSMVSGHQRRNRKSTIVVPLENGDQHTADQLTKIILGIYKRENVYDSISEAFHQGACISGMNMLHIYLDFQRDPVSGDIKIDNLPYNSFFVDPYFRKPDLSDASFVWRRSYLAHSAAAALMPDKYDEIMALQGNPTGTGRDGRFQYMPETYGLSHQNRVSYDEYYYRDYRKQRLLVDKQTGETFDVSKQEQLDIDTFLAHYPQVTMVEQSVPTVRLAIMIQDKVFYDGIQPLGIDRFPFVPILGYYNPMMPYFYSRIQSICRSLRDPQMLLNRRIILSADLLESQVNSGYIFKENAVIDVKHLFQTGQGRIIPLKATAQMTDIMPIVPPQIPPSFFQMQETFSKELNLVSGINEELMGANYDDKSGYRSALQQNAGLTTLQPIFDRLDNSQNLLGDIVIDVIQANYTPGKVQLLLEGDQPAPLFYNKAFGRYHSSVELGFNTETQKQMEFAQLLKLKEMGFDIPAERMIDAATLQKKDELIKQMQQNSQAQQQAQQQQLQSQMQLQQAQSKLAEARATADTGLGFERMSRVEENRQLAVERSAQAKRDDAETVMAYAKAMKELEDIDLSQLEKIINLQKVLRDIESPQAAQEGPVRKDRGQTL